MKKSICFALAVCLVFLLNSCDPCNHLDSDGDGLCDNCGKKYTVASQNGTPKYSEGLEFASLDDGTCMLCGRGTCIDAEIVIPPVSPEGDKVVSISGDAFSEREECEDIRSISIPDTVQEITKGAFKGCVYLQRIKIPFIGLYNGVEGAGAHFGMIFGLTQDPESDNKFGTSGPHHYASGTKTYYFAIPQTLETVVISDFCTEIGDNAFLNCTYIKNVEISKDARSIGSAAFRNCSSIENITIPSSVTSIGATAFMNCRSIKSINIPSSVMSIGASAFNGSGLSKVTFSGSSDWKTGGTSLSADELSDPSTAASYLGFVHVYSDWTRE